MYENCDYPTINKACNGTFVLYDGSWHLLIEMTGTVFNFGDKVKPSSRQVVLDNSDPIYDQLVISKKTYDLNWIKSLDYAVFGATW